uniref:Maturation protein n=1 Tax=Wenzhou levi-like virus 3 TaxID=1923569 RepID=A0A1L3KIZ4_9VIRU|nr:hypothetical protein [Wenzhou levi-like virus 3]
MEDELSVVNQYYVNHSTLVTEEFFRSVVDGYHNPTTPKVSYQKFDKYGIRPHSFWYSLPDLEPSGVMSYYIIDQRVGDVIYKHHIIHENFNSKIPDRKAAINKLNQQKFQHYQTKWGSEAAEMKQNLTILKDMLTLCIDAYKAFTRGNISKAARLLKVSSATIASPYLFYQFGIKPIFYLIGDIFIDLQKDIVKQSLHLHSARSRVWTESSYAKDYHLWGPDQKRIHVRISSTRQDIIGFNSDSLREPVDIVDLSSVINYLNPVRIAWELVPYSFIVDYFVGVSDFLGSYNQDYIVKEIYNSEFAGRRVGSSYCTVISQDDGQSVQPVLSDLPERTYFTRTPTSHPPISELRFNIDLNTSQLLATVAVLLQKIASSKLIK